MMILHFIAGPFALMMAIGELILLHGLLYGMAV